MNENLANALSGLISKAMDGLDAAQSFLTAEIPDVVQQLLMWKMAESIAWCVGGRLFIVIWLIYMWRMLKWAKSPCTIRDSKYDNRFDWWDGDETMGFYCGTFLPGIFPIIGFFACADLDWLQIWLAPKVYLIEYAANLVK